MKQYFCKLGFLRHNHSFSLPYGIKLSSQASESITTALGSVSPRHKTNTEFQSNSKVNFTSDG